MKPMNPLFAKIVFVGMLLGAGIIVQFFLFSQTSKGNTTFAKSLPSQIGAWNQVSAVSPTEAEFIGLETFDMIKRMYDDGRGQIELVVAHIPHSNRKSAHAQESCLRGAGALVSQVEKHQVPGTEIHSTHIALDQHGSRMQVMYWFKFGKQHRSDYMLASMTMFVKGLLGSEGSGSSLIRLLATRSPNEDEEQVKARLDAFALALKPVLDQGLP